MATHQTLGSLFTDIADAIRAKTGSSADIVADNFPTAISQIPTGGTSNLVKLTSASHTPSSTKRAYVDNNGTTHNLWYYQVTKTQIGFEPDFIMLTTTQPLIQAHWANTPSGQTGNYWSTVQLDCLLNNSNVRDGDTWYIPLTSTFSAQEVNVIAGKF